MLFLVYRRNWTISAYSTINIFILSDIYFYYFISLCALSLLSALSLSEEEEAIIIQYCSYSMHALNAHNYVCDTVRIS